MRARATRCSDIAGEIGTSAHSSVPTIGCADVASAEGCQEAVQLLVGRVVVRARADDLRQAASTEVELGRRDARDADVDARGGDPGADLVGTHPVDREGDDAGPADTLVAHGDAEGL